MPGDKKEAAACKSLQMQQPLLCAYDLLSSSAAALSETPPFTQARIKAAPSFRQKASPLRGSCQPSKARMTDEGMQALALCPHPSFSAHASMPPSPRGGRPGQEDKPLTQARPVWRLFDRRKKRRRGCLQSQKQQPISYDEPGLTPRLLLYSRQNLLRRPMRRLFILFLRWLRG